MSMLSSKCDRLRDTATRVEIFLEGCTDAIPTDTHEQLRSAADTIWELRNKLAGTVDQREEIERLEDENEKLRNERDHWRVEQVHAYSNWEDAHKRAIELEDENARLRSCLSDDAENARQIMGENAKLRKAAEFEHNQLEDIKRAADMMLEEHNAMLVENAKLRSLASELYQQVLQDDAAWRDVRAWEDGLPSDCLHPIRSYDDSLGKYMAAHKFEKRMCELGVEVRHV